MLMVEPPCPQPHLPSYFRVLEALVIIIGSIADLSSVGTKIAVEKDWVVVLAGSDKKLLARKKQSYFIFFTHCRQGNFPCTEILLGWLGSLHLLGCHFIVITIVILIIIIITVSITEFLDMIGC